MGSYWKYEIKSYFLQEPFSPIRHNANQECLKYEGETGSVKPKPLFKANTEALPRLLVSRGKEVEMAKGTLSMFHQNFCDFTKEQGILLGELPPNSFHN